MNCIHCNASEGHTDECITHKKTKCPPHTKGQYRDSLICIHCRTPWEEVPQLYAIAYEYRSSRNTWLPEFLYLHAVNDADARLQFFHSQSPHLYMRIVGIAPVLGYLVNDSHGEDLSV